jgi:hypothetical protein
MQLGPPWHTKGGGGRAADAAGRRDGRGAAGGRGGLQQPGHDAGTLERTARQPGEAREDAALRLALEVANSAHGAVIFACEKTQVSIRISVGALCGREYLRGRRAPRRPTLRGRTAFHQ